MRLDRKIPLFVSRGSSIAMRRILTDLGFSVTPVDPGKTLRFGKLRLLPIAADQVRDAIIEEWDSLAYVVYDDAGEGSFFAQVDMPVSDAMRRAVQLAVKRPVIWARTNNFADMYFQHHLARPNQGYFRTFVWHTIEDYQATSRLMGRPEALLLVGGGFSFRDRRINSTVFSWTSEEVHAAVQRLLPQEQIVHAVPGQTFTMQKGKLEKIGTSTPGVRARPRSSWPSRRFRGTLRWPHAFTPASGKKTFRPSDRAALESELDRFASHLYGSPVFREIYSLDQGQLGRRKPTFAIAAFVDARHRAAIFEYEPHACRFRSVACDDPMDRYWGVYECWASDLLAFLRAEMSSTALSFGRSRIFNSTPREFQFAIQRELFVYAHPLRMPDRFLALYRSVVERARGADL
jgi:hypothetical protein